MPSTDKELTPAQRERQSLRVRGRYAKTSPCEMCGKSAGINYFSWLHVDEPGTNGYGLVLCRTCARKLEPLSKDEGYAVLKEAWDKRNGAPPDA